MTHIVLDETSVLASLKKKIINISCAWLLWDKVSGEAYLQLGT